MCANWTISWIILWQIHHFIYLVPLESYSFSYHLIIFCLTTLSISSWCLCRFSDPGFIPIRSLPAFPSFVSSSSSSSASRSFSSSDVNITFSSLSNPSTSTNLLQNQNDISIPVSLPGGVYEWSEAYEASLSIGETGALCHLCRVVKPHRGGHCYTCGRCVLRYDHHCPFVGTCVGEANHRPFLVFITSTSLVAILYVWLNFKLFRSGQLILSDSIGTAVFAFHAFLMGIFVVGLTLFQFYLVSRNRSANEHIKPHDHKYLIIDSKGILSSPFDQGVISNCYSVLTADNRLATQLTRAALASSQKSCPYPYPTAKHTR